MLEQKFQIEILIVGLNYYTIKHTRTPQGMPSLTSVKKYLQYSPEGLSISYFNH